MSLVSAIGLILIGAGSVIVFQAINSIRSSKKKQTKEEVDIEKIRTDARKYMLETGSKNIIDVYKKLDSIFGIILNTVVMSKNNQDNDSAVNQINFKTLDGHHVSMIINNKKPEDEIDLFINDVNIGTFNYQDIPKRLIDNGVGYNPNLGILKLANAIKAKCGEDTKLYVSKTNPIYNGVSYDAHFDQKNRIIVQQPIHYYYRTPSIVNVVKDKNIVATVYEHSVNINGVDIDVPSLSDLSIDSFVENFVW